MAGMGFTFKIIGAQAIIKKLETKTAIKEPMNSGVKKIIQWLDNTVKTATPVDTGRLRSGITSKVTGESGQVGTTIEYASFVEYGTTKMEPRYVTPGTSTRVFGKGPFSFALEQLQQKIGDFLKDIGEAISVRFG